MTACKRVAKELEELLKQPPHYLRHLSSDDANVLVWHALLLPAKKTQPVAHAGLELTDQPPYHLRAFNLCINFPKDYPLKPPAVRFTTKIYHPNVSEDGQVCMPLISKENWKPHTKICQVLEALIILVNRPNLGEPVRMELADLLTQDPEKFKRKAEEFTLQYGVGRPS